MIFNNLSSFDILGLNSINNSQINDSKTSKKDADAFKSALGLLFSDAVTGTETESNISKAEKSIFEQALFGNIKEKS